MEGAQICGAFIIRATNSCSSAEVPLGSCVPEKWCSGLEKCLLMPPFLFTVIRERKAPAVLVSSISPGLWPTQGLKWTINQTHISDQTHTASSWNVQAAWSFQLGHDTKVTVKQHGPTRCWRNQYSTEKASYIKTSSGSGSKEKNQMWVTSHVATTWQVYVCTKNNSALTNRWTAPACRLPAVLTAAGTFIQMQLVDANLKRYVAGCV